MKYLDKGEIYNSRVVGLCLDTTRPNTSTQKGACARIEKALGKDLFHFACHYHVFEVILKAVVVAMLNLDEKSPEVQLFKDFKEITWCGINKQNHKCCLEDSEVLKKVKDSKHNLPVFAENNLKVVRYKLNLFS